MNNILIVAGKEIQEGLRNRWVLAATLILTVLSLTLTLLGSAPTGNVGASRLDVVIVSLSSLMVFLLPLIALLISHDAIAGEAERGTLLLLLSYPLGRGQIVLGKFLGHIAILCFSILCGNGVAALTLVLTGEAAGAQSWQALLSMTASSVLLGAGFLAIGYLISVLSAERSTAAGIAIGVWLFFVLIYDMALLGALVAAQGRSLPAGLLDMLLLANPTDAYRLFNLGAGGAALVSGLGGLARNSLLSSPVLVAALVFWIAAPLALTSLIFSRREI